MPRSSSLWSCLIAAFCFVVPAHAQQETLGGEGDGWARFGVGSWKLVRLYSETINRDGLVEATSTQDVRSTLVEAGGDDYLLKIETIVEAAGKRIEAEPKFVRRGAGGETNGQEAAIRRLGDAELDVGSRKIPTQIFEIVLSGREQRRVRTVHYAPTVAPFVLRQEVLTTSSDGTLKILDAISEVIALDMPYKVLSQIKTTAFVQTVKRMATGERTITLEVICSDVPGGIVSHSEKSLDKSGRTVQRTTLELLDYGVLPQTDTHTATRFRRPLRARRNAKR